MGFRPPPPPTWLTPNEIRAQAGMDPLPGSAASLFYPAEWLLDAFNGGCYTRNELRERQGRTLSVRLPNHITIPQDRWFDICSRGAIILIATTPAIVVLLFWLWLHRS